MFDLRQSMVSKPSSRFLIHLVGRVVALLTPAYRAFLMLDLNRRKLRAVRSFTFEPSVYCGWPNSKAYDNVFKLVGIRQHDDKGKRLFHNLTVAKLNLDSRCGGHKLCQNGAFDDSWPTPTAPSLLAGVETLYLKDLSFSHLDEFSSVFRVLGMQEVETLHIDFVPYMYIPVGLSSQLRSLQNLKTIHLNLEQQFVKSHASPIRKTYIYYAASLSTALLELADRKDQFSKVEKIHLGLSDFRVQIVEPLMESRFAERTSAKESVQWLKPRLQWS